MKKILLASTILVGTTGFAAAEVTFTGSAYFGIAASMNMNEAILGFDADQDGVLGETDVTMLTPEIASTFTAGMMTTTDMGLEAGASITVFASRSLIQNGYGDDEFGTEDWNGGGISGANAYISGDWGKLAVDYDTNADDSNATPGDPDVTFTYSHSFGDFGVSAYYVMTEATSTATTNGDFGAAVTYSFGDYGIDVSYDWDNDDMAGAGTNNIGAGVTANFSGLKLAANVDYDLDEDELGYDASASYTMNAFTVGAQVEWDGYGADGVYDNGDEGYNFGLTAAYDLGGGVSVTGSYMSDYSNQYVTAGGTAAVVKAGVSMRF